MCYFVALVEVYSPKLFVGEVHDGGPDVEEEVVAVFDDVVLAFLLFFQHPVAQLEGGKYGDGLGGAKTFDVCCKSLTSIRGKAR